MPSLSPIRPLWGARSVHAVIACLAAGGLAWQLVAVPSAWPWALALIVAPDIPLLAGMGHDGVPGRLRPAAVPAYNALHMYWGPVLLAVAAVVAVGAPATAAALAWTLHIGVDRALGFGLRTRAGDQRPRP